MGEFGKEDELDTKEEGIGGYRVGAVCVHVVQPDVFVARGSNVVPIWADLEGIDLRLVVLQRPSAAARVRVPNPDGVVITVKRPERPERPEQPERPCAGENDADERCAERSAYGTGFVRRYHACG